MRSAAGPASGDEVASAEVIEYCRYIAGRIGYQPAWQRIRAAIAGPRVHDAAQARPGSRVDDRLVVDQAGGRARVEHQRQAVGRPGREYLDNPAFCELDVESPRRVVRH